MIKKKTLHKWQDWERELIRLNYRGDRYSVEVLANQLGVTPEAVRWQIKRLGLCGRRGIRKIWTLAEDDKLRELWPQYAPLTVARKMRRSISSVITRAHRLGLSRQYRDGWYTKQEVCQILAIGREKIQRFIDLGMLRASYHYGPRLQQNGRNPCWHINQKDLKAFIRRYPQELNGRNIDLIQIVEILVGLDFKDNG